MQINFIHLKKRVGTTGRNSSIDVKKSWQ